MYAYYTCDMCIFYELKVRENQPARLKHYAFTEIENFLFVKFTQWILKRVKYK